MADDKKNTETSFPFPEIELPELVRDEDDGDTAPKGKALVPFDPLQRYLAEIRRFKVLSREEEHELAVQYKEYGDLEAAYKLVTANLRLVVKIAYEYRRAYKNMMDLIQEGNMGLIRAV